MRDDNDNNNNIAFAYHLMASSDVGDEMGESKCARIEQKWWENKILSLVRVVRTILENLI